MQELINNFDFNGHGVRVIRNINDQVFFVAKDVCDVLGYRNSPDAISKHCKIEGVANCYIPHPQSETKQLEVITINEGNLYRLVLRSKKKEAEKFESWVCDEVLPTIRKNGKYESKPKTQIEALLESVQMLAVQEQRLSQVETKLAQLEESRNVAAQELLIAERSTEAIPEETTRVKIRRLINQYCNAKNADQRSVWHVVYDRLYYRYGVSLRAIVKARNESTLDVAERLGHLDKIFAICSNELV